MSYHPLEKGKTEPNKSKVAAFVVDYGFGIWLGIIAFIIWG